MPNKNWDTAEVSFLIANYNTLSNEEIGIYLNRSTGAVTAKCCQLGLKKKQAWSDSEISYLKSNYNFLTQEQIANYLGRTKSAVNIKASKLGLKKRYEYNHDYFECIDSEDKAYWLGFIWTDGALIKNEKTNSGELSIELQLQDKEHLKKFNKSIDGNLQVKERTRSNCFSGKYKDNVYITCFIRVHSIKIVNDLIKLGCTPNKSATIGLPDLPENLMWHFIRGYFDGDGCVAYQDHKTNVRCDFTSISSSLINQLRTWLYQHGINSYITHDKNNLRLCIAGRDYNLLFLSKIYDNSTIYLSRKYQKQLQIRNHITQQKSA